MLQAQVNYWNLQETKRHNLTAEELERINLDIRSKEQQETQRHNQMSEVISISDINEKRRHNLASENLGFDTLAETQRHNVQTEKLAQQQQSIDWYNATTNRQNAQTNAFNATTSRYSAEQQAGIGWQNAGTNKVSVDVAARNAETARRSQQETARHNAVQEFYGAFDTSANIFSTAASGYSNIKTANTKAATEARQAAEQTFWNTNW